MESIVSVVTASWIGVVSMMDVCVVVVSKMPVVTVADTFIVRVSVQTTVMGGAVTVTVEPEPDRVVVVDRKRSQSALPSLFPTISNLVRTSCVVLDSDCAYPGNTCWWLLRLKLC